ncbi:MULTISPECIES: fimbria/pilus chaperone family protein [Pseudomonas]|jgi:P pilus assembly chaperone PapD|uniref:Fimbria/pilus periplasmic chaperone n=2 Tax=Pseudomonas TaxID=286 RepID=A0A7M2J9I8_PSEFL|nr:MULTISPECIES: fimbria/pilus chaperone family protein [Pseudomonas]MBL1308312.1 fimbria/pilus periplasmic chaperone [Pseudomonas sp.]PMX12672.1 fimbrial chaperone protein [Pseudomonas sp. MPBC4-3]PMX45275.1 fimbrial chaperone protein [Pseudomonas sp. FW301-21B01]PMY05308.1 fimbrial chaperone protein [Pseudomonas sp. MPR-R5A]PNA65950.1 fimbrial chaperone protein [Pseudomonas sp. MPR-R5B]
MTMYSSLSTWHWIGLTLGLLCVATASLADGMVPDTSVVLVYEADGEASVSVSNTDNKVALMHVTLENIPEDPETLLFVTPPLSRVEASKSQLVRFILQSQEPLKTQRLKRVIFEGMPAQQDPNRAGRAQVGVTVRQNLPVIIHPKGLARNREPWLGLTWHLDNDQLSVRNPTPYVVRLAQELQLLPGNGSAMLPRTYVLPGETLTVTTNGAAATTVRLQPATVYGFAVPAHDAAISL